MSAETAYVDIFREIDNGKREDELIKQFAPNAFNKKNYARSGTYSAIIAKIQRSAKVTEIVRTFEEKYGISPESAEEVRMKTPSSAHFITTHRRLIEEYISIRNHEEAQ